MRIVIPLENEFNLPAGQFRGRLANLARKPSHFATASGEQIRFLFELDIPSIKNRIPMAGRNFALSLKGGSELRRFLEGWLGKRFFAAKAGQPLDLESLIGRAAELVLTHFQQIGYDQPMVCIASAAPLGTLALTEQPAPEGKD